MKKSIAHILLGRDKKITEEEIVKQSLPHKDFRFANPFIVVHHMLPEQVPAGSKVRIHPHPHRGFAPVTFLLQGENYHKDSAGNEGIMSAGDVQYMLAGKGILHSEGPSQDFLNKGGTQELIQLWVNVPKAHKWDEPSYQTAEKAAQPVILKQDGVHMRLASGNFDGQVGPIKTFTPIIMASGEVEKGKQLDIKATPGYWTLLYIIKGGVTVNGTEVEPYNLIVFEKENDEITVVANEDSQILFLSAEPLDEPVAAKDNFVMNTPEEIDQAMEDYKNGLFGELNY